MIAMTHNFCNFPSLDGKEIDCELQTIIINHLSFMHDNIQAHFQDLLQLTMPPFVNFLHTMTIEDVMEQPECVQIEPCEAIADEHLIKDSEKYWINAWLRGTIKYRILYEKVAPFIINLPSSN